MLKEWRKERFCGLGTRLALEIRDQFPAVQQTDFEQTAKFHDWLLQKGLITLLFSHLPSCFCRNWTLEGCLPWHAALGLLVGPCPLSKGDSCIVCASESCCTGSKFITHSRVFINWCLIEVRQHKWYKRLCGCYYPFPFQEGGTEFLDHEGLSFVRPIPWACPWPHLMVLTAPQPLAAVEKPVGLPWPWSCPSCPEVSSLLGTPMLLLEMTVWLVSCCSHASHTAVLCDSLCRLAGFPAFHASLVLMNK